MRSLFVLLCIALLTTGAWAGLNDPGFEAGGAWTKAGPVSDHIPYSFVAPYGIPVAPSGGAYAGGVAAANTLFPGGEFSQIVDQSQTPGWNPNVPMQTLKLGYHYYAVGLADVPMLMNTYIAYMTDGSYPSPASPNYVKQKVVIQSGNSGGWVLKSPELLVAGNIRYVGIHFECTYFGGTGAMLVDNVTFTSAPVTAQDTDIAGAKKLQDGKTVRLSDKVVTAAFGTDGFFYICEQGRNAGIRVRASAMPSGANLVTVTGALATVGGEREIVASSVAEGAATPRLDPFGIKGNALGGGAFGLQSGIAGASDLSNVGLPVKAWGLVTRIDATNFRIDDGAGSLVKVVVAPGTPLPIDGTKAVVSGICSVYDFGGLRPLIRAVPGGILVY